MHYYTDVLKKYAVFSGRARRQEFWMFVLCNLVVDVVLVTLDVVLGTSGIIDGVYTLAVLLPWVGLTVRRLHDTGRSGWWYLLVLIPLLGWIWLIVLMATEGEAGPNKYGPSPKAIHA
ncbi:DUF805 domain-containing protein [Streptomyces sp. NBC_00190]|uniref:DUF805 domain-containing protein n=1 Tax=unclassified Streptomyces TaxID=2593676 RepID=UPI002E2C68B2|nr:DUF805 domain-containing protein [Streptomyces sp. NBC_00190]WSZ45217.1 DUF805 domain-containing protein [Streptomyces sp. NBC_00868]